MASQGGTTLLEQFQEMLRRNRSKLQAKTIAAVNGMIPHWMGMLIDTVAGFENVTGNTITGLIIGGSIGGGVGLVSGVVSPGLHFKAKKGEKLILEVQDNLKVPCQ